MKKISKLLLGAALISSFALIGCSDDDDENNSPKPRSIAEIEKRVAGRTFSDGTSSFVLKADGTGSKSAARSARAVSNGDFEWKAEAGEGNALNVTINGTKATFSNDSASVLTIDNTEQELIANDYSANEAPVKKEDIVNTIWLYRQDLDGQLFYLAFYDGYIYGGNCNDEADAIEKAQNCPASQWKEYGNLWTTEGPYIAWYFRKLKVNGTDLRQQQGDENSPYVDFVRQGTGSGVVGTYKFAEPDTTITWNFKGGEKFGSYTLNQVNTVDPDNPFEEKGYWMTVGEDQKIYERMLITNDTFVGMGRTYTKAARKFTPQTE